MDIGMVDVWRELNPTKRDYTSIQPDTNLTPD